MLNWFHKPTPVHFQVVQPAGERYFVIRKKVKGRWQYLYHFTTVYYDRTEFSWHADRPSGATKYATKEEAINLVKTFPEFDDVVWEAHGGVVRDLGSRAELEKEVMW